MPIDGVWTLADHVIEGFFRQLVEEDLIDLVFYETGMPSAENFLQFCQSPQRSMVFVALGDKPVGFSWLSPISGNFAFGHFGFFREFWGHECREAAPHVLNHYFSFNDAHGDRLLDVIIGCVPRHNERANKFTKAIGGTELGAIPYMFRGQDGDRQDAMIYYFVPESEDG